LVSGTRGRGFESRIAHHILNHTTDMPMAMSKKKKLTLLIIVAAVFYLVLSYHFIIIEGDIRQTRLLRKSAFTFKYMIFSTKGKSNKAILAIDILRENGIGDLLIEEGLMTEEEEILILESLKTQEE
jgi:hypothetical protein